MNMIVISIVYNFQNKEYVKRSAKYAAQIHRYKMKFHIYSCVTVKYTRICYTVILEIVLNKYMLINKSSALNL